LKQRDHEDGVAQPEHPTLPSPNNPPHHPSTTLLRVPNQQTPAFMSSCNTPDQGKVVVELPQAEKADVLPRLLNLLAIPTHLNGPQIRFFDSVSMKGITFARYMVATRILI